MAFAIDPVAATTDGIGFVVRYEQKANCFYLLRNEGECRGSSIRDEIGPFKGSDVVPSR